MEKLTPYVEIYGKEMLREFFDYWAEMNEGGKKMRFEMEKVFDLARRLKTWDKNNKFRNNGKSGIAKIAQQQGNLNSLIAAKYGGEAR